MEHKTLSFKQSEDAEDALYLIGGEAQLAERLLIYLSGSRRSTFYPCEGLGQSLFFVGSSYELIRTHC
jgi:hypothetical protein